MHTQKYMRWNNDLTDLASCVSDTVFDTFRSGFDLTVGQDFRIVRIAIYVFYVDTRHVESTNAQMLVERGVARSS